MDEERFEDFIENYTQPSDIDAALQEKEVGESEGWEPFGEVVKNYPKPQRELDLHKKTAAEAQQEIEWFIQNAQHQRIRTVRIITGKGLHSPGQKSVLPEMTEQKIAELKQAGIVLGSKREKNGGAIIVYLK